MFDLEYLDQSAGFNYCVSELGNKDDPSNDPNWERCFFFPHSDIAGNIRETFRKEVKDGKLVFETPQDFADYTEFEAPPKMKVR